MPRVGVTRPVRLSGAADRHYRPKTAADWTTIPLSVQEALDVLRGTAGNVSGPTSSTDNAIARWDGTGGDTLKDGGIIVTDAKAIEDVASIKASFNTFTFYDNLGNAAFVVWAAGAPVNYFVFRSSGTGNALQLMALGSDSDIGMDMVPKGTGPLRWGTDELVTLARTQTLTNKTLTTPTIADLTNATHDHSSAAQGGAAKPLIIPPFQTALKDDGNGRIFGNVHVATGTGTTSYFEGIGVAGNLASNQYAHVYFRIPDPLPPGTLKLQYVVMADATSGNAKFEPFWASIAAEENPANIVPGGEGVQTVTWSAGDAHVFKIGTVVLDVDTPVAGEILILKLEFYTLNWTLASDSTWRFGILWE